MATMLQVKNVMDSTFEKCRELRAAGQKEYAHTEDNAFRNFESVGTYLQLDRRKVLWTYLQKHLDGIVAYINGHKSQREDVRGRIHDAIVYLVLLKAMIEEDDGIIAGDAIIEKLQKGGVLPL